MFHGKTSEIHHTLLQKRDGTFYLVLWNEIVSYDNAAERDINVPEQTVTLKLTTPIHLAKTFLPLNGFEIEEYRFSKGLQYMFDLIVDVSE